MDKRVELHGTSRADMNGKRGVVTDFHPVAGQDDTTWRYSVKLDGGEHSSSNGRTCGRSRQRRRAGGRRAGPGASERFAGWAALI